MHDDLPPTHHIENEGDVVRAPLHDYVDSEGIPQEAWQYTDPCDETCHHPIHSLKVPKGGTHLSWMTPNSSLPKPLKETS